MQTILFAEENIIIIAKWCITVIACAVSLIMLRIIVQAVRKYRFCKRYGIAELPASIKIKGSKMNGVNEFELQYPFWCHEKKDGTADKRYTRNPIVWPKSYLWIGSNVLSSRKPTAILNTVAALRKAGVPVELSEEEEKKRRRIAKKKKALSIDATLQRIVDMYSEHPTEFEQVCAELFKKMGYVCYVTPKTNDGGFDIFLQKGKETGIVECKCYGKKHRVGRPEIQKLVGANVIAEAQNLLFVTTSDFTPEAQIYAEKSGVTLISGQDFLKMLQEFGYSQEDVCVQPEEWQLDIYDLKDYIPKDIYQSYFE